MEKAVVTLYSYYTSNRLQTAEDVRELSHCLKLSVLDLSSNNLESAEVLDILASMQELHVLNVTNNHIIRETREYR